jgi:hypothetical protein
MFDSGNCSRGLELLHDLTSTEKAKGIWLCADHFSASIEQNCGWVDLNLASNPDLIC